MKTYLNNTRFITGYLLTPPATLRVGKNRKLPNIYKGYHVQTIHAFNMVALGQQVIGHWALTVVFLWESYIMKWDFDIPTCSDMIHNPMDRKFKFCEIKEYML